MSKLLTKEEIFNNPKETIKFLCFDIYITTDNQVFSLKRRKLREQLIGGSYCYFCNGKYRTKTWIRKNCVHVLGVVTN
jgi:hypothetical protein